MKKSLAFLVLLFTATLGFSQGQPINILSVGSSAVVTGNGTAAGAMRVSIASDNTAFAVNATLQTGANTVGKFDLLGNGGATMDVAQGGGTAATNALQTAGVFNTALPTLTNGQGGVHQLDAKAQTLVDLNYVNGSAIVLGNGTATGSVRVSIASDNTAFSVNAVQSGNWTSRIVGNAGAIFDFVGQNAVAPANAILMGGEFNTSPTTITSGSASPFQLDNAGKLLVNCSNCSAAATVSLNPSTTGGLSMAHVVTAATTNATSLKASAGQVYRYCVNNNTTYPVFLKFYNKASAPTVGTDPVLKVMEAQAGVPACAWTEEGLTFGTGIAWAVTKGITDADTTAVALSDATVEIDFK